MADIPRLPQGTTAFPKGKELFDKGLAKGFNITPGSDYLFQETKMAVAYHTSLDNIEHLNELEKELRVADFNVKAPFWDEDGTAGEILIYILIEHQSEPDVSMGFRMLKIPSIGAVLHDPNLGYTTQRVGKG